MDAERSEAYTGPGAAAYWAAESRGLARRTYELYVGPVEGSRG